MEKRLLWIALLFLCWNCETIFVENISKEQVVLLAPATNAELLPGTIAFNWQEITDATAYKIEIATPDFTNANQILLDSTTTALTILKKLDAGNYEWRVKALNSDYTTVYSTNNFSIIDTVTLLPSATINLLLPIEDKISNSTNQTLVWESLEGATEYRIQLWSPDEDGTKIEDETFSTTHFEFDFPDGDFTWSVRGQSDTQNTVFTSRKIKIDTENPNTPLLTSPDDNETIAVTTAVNFKWTRTDVEGAEELDSLYIYTDSTLETIVFKDKATDKEYTKSDLTVGDYYWIVNAFDAAGNISTVSTTHKLTIN